MPDADALLEGLDPDQRTAVTTDELPLAVLAGAGTGKTRVLTRRIAWRAATGREAPRHALALTFTRAAATELRLRLRSLGLRDDVRAGTFHAVALAELRERWVERGQRPAALLEDPRRVLRDLVSGDAATLRRVADEVAWASARGLGPGDYAAAAVNAGRTPPRGHAATAEVLARYAEQKRRRGLVDFDDLLRLLTAEIADDATFAAAQRWRFRHLYVDEFQDLNPVQFGLLEAWRGDRPDLCAVGDPNQAIYGWNGADPTYLTAFGERDAAATTVRVARNYRATPQLVAVANAVLDGGDLPGVRLTAARDDGPVPVVHGYAGPDDEAAAVARAVLDLHGPASSYRHQAVLARTNARLEPIQAALAAVGVPSRMLGRRAAAEEAERRGAIRALLGHGGSFRAAAGAIAADTDDESGGVAARLADLADRYLSEVVHPDAHGFVAWLELNAPEFSQPDDAVTLATFHAAKGLEWRAVHLVGVEDGAVPDGRARGDALLEERRLFYVASTRASDVLRLSWAATSASGMARRPSPYLAELAPVLGRLARRAAPVDVKPVVRTARPDDPRDAARDALDRWRVKEGRARGVPPVAVLSERALRAIVQALPHDAESLAALDGVAPVVLSGRTDEVLEIVRAATTAPARS